MNRLLLSLAAAALSMTASAQYILVNDELPIPASEVEKITYEQDDQFDALLLPGMMASDRKVSLFSQALQLTGLADTLRTYIYDNYQRGVDKFYYRAHVWREVAWYNENRYKMFTVFAETDSALAVNGINNLDQLKAYAKQVYDESFPEDASVSDPTDRRNSLNRFVAYHILPHGSSYWYLTAYDGKQSNFWMNTRMADMSAWYATLMPYGSLKCSYPMAGADSGIYLNRRGVGDQPDKYGKQIRGAKVVADGEQGFDHLCFNGYYFHIDSLLVYDKKTREDVLSTELWRVDFKTLCPDIMNNADELRGNYLVDDDMNSFNDDPNPVNGRNYVYKWDCMENIQGDTARINLGLIHRRAHINFWSWQGDEVNVFGDYDFTIKLPPLPPAEWEIRMGICAIPTRGAARIYLNGVPMIDSLNMTHDYYGVDVPFGNHPLKTEILDYMAAHFFTAEYDSIERSYLVTDLKTNEKIWMVKDPYDKRKTSSWSNTYTYNGVLAQERIDKYSFRGRNPDTDDYADWSQRAYEYREQALIEVVSDHPKCMHGPRECTLGQGGRNSFADLAGLVRFPIGRIVTDGKHDNYLRIENLPLPYVVNNTEAQFDYFEFVPKFVYDNQEIPEE